MIDYRATFRDLLGERASVADSAAADAWSVELEDAGPGVDETHVAQAQPTVMHGTSASEVRSES